MEIALIIVGSIVGLIVLLILVLPSEVTVERSVNVNAPVEKPFEQVNELKNWPNWSPWSKIDPKMEVTYSDVSSGQGAWYSWKSDHKNVGNGKLTLQEVVPNQKTVQLLQFEKWDDGEASMHFESNGDTSKVTWSMTAQMPGAKKLFGPMMKKMLGKQFDEGLAGIKSHAEA